MLHNNQSKHSVWQVAAKEISLFFSSPIAYLFLGAFALITLYIFFWGEAFFARNIADVRPLFEKMPLFLIFLTAALTMKMWSEEHRNGTIEYLLTQSKPLWQFVVGKFVACLFLLAVALLITLPLPISVSMIGQLDWGPVIAGYLAALFLGAAYISIGLFASSKSENQIVSLIYACGLSGLFYLIGHTSVTNLFSTTISDWLHWLGTGAHFESITRGVIDIRDFYYYISLAVFFLFLSAFTLEKRRWVNDRKREHHQHWYLVSLLVVVNLVAGHLFFNQLRAARLDLTDGQQYTISDGTEGYLDKLQQPLLIRGYFSGKTHPLLAPLVPQMKDLLKEYEVSGNGNVHVELVDPLSSPALEEEANQKYGIKPIPFQVADRYQASIMSSYFDILVQYGDEHTVLGFSDLIEVKSNSEGDIDVQLRNPEHDVTRTIKKIMQTYQSGGKLFDSIDKKLTLMAYVSEEDKLPTQLREVKSNIDAITKSLSAESAGKFTVNYENPDQDTSLAEKLESELGLRPFKTSIFSNNSFFFHLVLNADQQAIPISLGDLSKETIEKNIQTAVKRFQRDRSKTVSLIVPKADQSSFGRGQVGFNTLERFLGEELNVIREGLVDGEVSPDADILLLAAPKDLDEKSLYAVDQFLMKGGTVVAVTNPFSPTLSTRQLNLQKHNSGLQDWLAHHGLTVEEKLVLDEQNTALPVPVTRNVAGFSLQEIRMLDYPYFIDVRQQGLNQDSLITANLPQVTVPWASPITVAEATKKDKKVTELLRSSEGSWLSESLDVMPVLQSDGSSHFKTFGDTQSYLLGVAVQGQFKSYFAEKAKSDSDENAELKTLLNENSLTHSPASAQIILLSSNALLNDQIMQMQSAATQTAYLAPVELVSNAIDASLEDQGLLGIRSRSHFNRTLPPMEKSSQLFWEYLNYGLAVLLIAVIALWSRHKRQAKNQAYLELLNS